jgi:hypothetical protein
MTERVNWKQMFAVPQDNVRQLQLVTTIHSKNATRAAQGKQAQALFRLGVARKASLDLLMAPERPPEVWRGSLLVLVGVFGGGAGVRFIFLLERASSWLGPSFSLSDVSWSVSSLRFVPSTREDTLLSRTMRIVPDEVGPKQVSKMEGEQR